MQADRGTHVYTWGGGGGGRCVWLCLGVHLKLAGEVGEAKPKFPLSWSCTGACRFCDLFRTLYVDLTARGLVKAAFDSSSP